MNEIEQLLSQTNHRPWQLPSGRWMYYQEWNEVLFLHWKVPMEQLRKWVPSRLKIETFEGDAYLSIVLFRMENIRPRYLPSLDFISDFEEINVRTYVSCEEKTGIYFLNIEAAKLLPALLAKKLSGLPYEKAIISKSGASYRSGNKRKGFSIEVDYHIQEMQESKSDLDLWLTEKYCVYVEEGSRMYRYNVHHQEWTVKKVSLQKLDLTYRFGEIHLNQLPHLAHYSEGVKVLAWKKEICHG